MIDHRSASRFSTGVPVSASRKSACSVATACARLRGRVLQRLRLVQHQRAPTRLRGEGLGVALQPARRTRPSRSPGRPMPIAARRAPPSPWPYTLHAQARAKRAVSAAQLPQTEVGATTSAGPAAARAAAAPASAPSCPGPCRRPGTAPSPACGQPHHPRIAFVLVGAQLRPAAPCGSSGVQRRGVAPGRASALRHAACRRLDAQPSQRSRPARRLPRRPASGRSPLGGWPARPVRPAAGAAGRPAPGTRLRPAPRSGCAARVAQQPQQLLQADSTRCFVQRAAHRSSANQSRPLATRELAKRLGLGARSRAPVCRLRPFQRAQHLRLAGKAAELVHRSQAHARARPAATRRRPAVRRRPGRAARSSTAARCARLGIAVRARWPG